MLNILVTNHPPQRQEGTSPSCTNPTNLGSRI